MCIILSVDHEPCSHTVALLQPCVDAPRSKTYGHEQPCAHIRHHTRTIHTKKVCHNCGGPRYFERRGGIAERGRGSVVSIPEKERADDEHSDANDSGYHSDIIYEEEEESSDDDQPLSPRTPHIRARRRWRERVERRKRSASGQRSPSRSHSRKPSWKPNLKRDLDLENEVFYRRGQSIDSQISNFDGNTGIKWAASFEEMEINESANQKRDVTAETERRRPPLPRRKSSTLLHPSMPPEETDMDQENVNRYSVPPTPLTELKTVLCVRPKDPKLASKNRAPLVNRPNSTTPSFFNHPRGKAERRGSVLHSSLSDNEDDAWDAPLHSAHSDAEYESDERESEEDTWSLGSGLFERSAQTVGSRRTSFFRC